MTENEFATGKRADGSNVGKPDFIRDALRTKSPNFYGQMVGQKEFDAIVNNCIDALTELDLIKKSLFYGRDYKLRTLGLTNCIMLPARISDNKDISVDLIHGILGKATEAGELLEALQLAIKGKPLDFVNVNEEIGDGFWYDAILLNRTGATFESVQATIIAKLRARFPEAYADSQANERDLEAERKILEDNS